jgi:hypothetical protein
VIAVTSIAGNASAIPAGIVVFGDPVGGHTLEIAVRMFAFVLVIAAAALIPAPVRAALGDGAAEQEAADDRDDRRDERDAEADDVDRGQDEADDGHDTGRTPGEHELVGAALAAPSRGRSA